jgi:glycine/D-amino acid oxidase-like deaminating enzyme
MGGYESISGSDDDLEGEARARPGAGGLRPMTPGGRVGNLFVNTGHGPLGRALAAGSARLLAAMIAGEATPVDAAPFAVPATLMTGVSVVSGTSVFHP